MNMLDHPGPKGQIVLKGRERPVWFSSVRDTFAYTMLPEELHDYRGDLRHRPGGGSRPVAPGPRPMDRGAQRVVRHRQRVEGGMGDAEPLPFAREAAARAFAA